MKSSTSVLALNIFCVVFLAVWCAWFFGQPPDPPYIAIGRDSVIPVKVRAGESVEIFRTFRITRKQSVYIQRSMTNACQPVCEIMDLPSGYINLKPGDYAAIARHQVIPANTTPGLWTLAFTAQWEDKFGRTFSVPLPPLMIEVIK